MTNDDTTSMIQGAAPMALRASDFRLHALDLNPDLAAPLTGAGLAPGEHWILQDSNYRSIMADLVNTVRGMQRAADTIDERSDGQVCMHLLQSMRLWDCAKPAGQWGNARFMARFLVTFSRLYWPLMAQDGLARGRRTRRKSLAAFG